MRPSFDSCARRSSVLGALAVAAAALVALPGVAHAEDKHACVRASDRGQELRDSGKLRAARQEFVSCARAACPSIVRSFCAVRIDDVERALPTVVVRARDASGGDVVDVKVTADGAVLATRLDGAPLPMDPGEHTFRFETAGAPAIEQRVLLRTGEKNRSLDVSFASNPPPVVAAPAPVAPVVTRGKTPPATTAPARAPDVVEEHRPIPTSSIVAAAIGVAGLGASLGLVLAARSDVADVRGTCAPGCTEDELAPAHHKVTYANIAAGVGGAALVTAVVLFLTRPTEAHRAPAVTVGAAPLPGGGAASLGLRF